MTIKRYQIGEPVTGWPVDSWNEIADAVERGGPDGYRAFNGVPLAAGIFLLVKPDVQIGQRGIVSIGSIYRDPNTDANKAYLQQSPVFSATSPVDGDKSPGVSFEGIDASGSPGWVMVSGVAWAKVNITNASHEFCEVTASNVTEFTSAESGIKIKWKPAGTGSKICAVLLCLNTDSNEPAEAPLGDPPVADGVQDTGTSGFIGLDATGSTAASGLSLTKAQWVFSLPSSHTLILSGNWGSPPNFVYDSRGTLSLSDVGTAITGNVEDVVIDETAGSLSGPYTVTIVVTQTDLQTDNASAT